MGLFDAIEWLCLAIDGIIFIYLYYMYKKNGDSISKEVKIENGKVIVKIFIIVNVILSIIKIINL